MALTLMQEKYILRAQASPNGWVKPEGKQQTQLCEKLVEIGEFVRLRDGAYTTQAIADEIGLEYDRPN